MKTACSLIFWLLLNPYPLFAEKQIAIFSPEVVLSISTYETVYTIHNKHFAISLGREMSYANFIDSSRNLRHRYTAIFKYTNGDTDEEVCLNLPEIGEWSIERSETRNIDNTSVSIDDYYVIFKCKIYTEGNIVYAEFPITKGVMSFYNNTTMYNISTLDCWHYGERPSTENICHIRSSREQVYSKTENNIRFEIFLASDSYAKKFERRISNYDDVYLYLRKYSDKTNLSDLSCFIIPRIFFVKIENNSINVQLDRYVPKMHFVVVVQKFINEQKNAWDYRRLEIIRDNPPHEIQINDLGPVPRSEWEPGWPDPATTPLWKAIEDPYAHDVE
jgi:hypothetical protein